MQLVKKLVHFRMPRIRWQKLHKDQKGLTLIELLAVIVVLGIIAAIAIPSVNSIIKNTEARTQVANAKLIVKTARLAVADKTFREVGTDTVPSGFVANNTFSAETADKKRTIRFITLDYLIDHGYIESLIDPQTNSDYKTAESYVAVAMFESGDPGDYLVEWEYAINLVGETKTYFDDELESDI